jgi:hypothetical protein
MNAAELRATGRIAAALLLVQMIMAPLANFRLLASAVGAPPGFLVNAAPHAPQVYAAVLLLIAGGLCAVALALVVHAPLARHDRAAAQAFVVLAGVGLALACAEGAALRSMVALSEAYAGAGAGAASTFEPARVLVRTLRLGSHYAHLLTSGIALLLLYLALGRHRLVPRWLGALGVVAATLVVTGALVPLLGRPVVMWLFMPMGIAHLLLVGWLLAFGLAGRTATTEAIP